MLSESHSNNTVENQENTVESEPTTENDNESDIMQITNDKGFPFRNGMLAIFFSLLLSIPFSA